MTYQRWTRLRSRSGGAAWTVAIVLPVSLRHFVAATVVVAALVLDGSANGQCEPTILGSVDTPGGADGVAVSGAVAYISGVFSLHVIDVSSCQPCPADLDGSGDVDFEDILRVLDAWGNKGGPEDIDGSGTVDFDDLLIVLDSWGPCE